MSRCHKLQIELVASELLANVLEWEAQDSDLCELRKATLVPQHTKDRAFVLLLNTRGRKNSQIAEILNWAQKTVRQTIHRWQTKGLVGLWDSPGCAPSN